MKKKSKRGIMVESLDKTLVIFTGHGISGSVITNTEFENKNFLRLIRKGPGTKALNKKNTRFEVDEKYFRNIWYNDDFVRRLEHRTIRFDEVIEKEKVGYKRPKAAKHVDSVPIFAVKV